MTCLYITHKEKERETEKRETPERGAAAAARYRWLGEQSEHDERTSGCGRCMSLCLCFLPFVCEVKALPEFRVRLKSSIFRNILAGIEKSVKKNWLFIYLLIL